MISTGRVTALISNLIGLFFTVLIAYLLVDMGYGYLKLRVGDPEKLEREVKTDSKRIQEKKALSEYLSSSKKKPFGEPPSPGAAEPKEKKPPEPTTLKLTLLGTIVGDERGLGAVILDQTNKKQELYRIGDSIQGATIASIERGRVILKVGDREQILSFEDVGKQPSQPSQAPPPPAPQASAPTEIQIQRGDLEAQLQDLAKLMSQVNLAPHFKDGQPAGIGIHRIAPGSIFQRMGLQNGDILVGVEGNPINSPEELINLYDRLKNAESVRIQVERGGVPKEIEYKIR